MNRRLALTISLGAALLPLRGIAQSNPASPLRILVPFPPGGPADLLARTLAQGLQEAWNQPVLVDNRAGAGGQVGMTAAAKAAPDGYTLVVAPVGNIAVAPSLTRDLPYRQDEFAPVTMLAEVENVLAVHPGVPATSVKELIALAKAKPKSLTFGSPGAGSQAHLAGELLGLEAGVDLTHVPYRGMAQAVTDLLGGQISMMFGSMSSVLQHAQTGKLRPLGVSSLKRSSAAPDLATVAEQGFPGFEAVSWYALLAPAGTPRPVIDTIQKSAAQVLQRPENRASFAKQGMTGGGGSPEALAATIAADTRRWAEVIRKRNITAG
jgi:tripartite-type tricarboxylate transporter receptor subunit TctC